MSETTAPATETAASRVWRNDAILPVICSMSDDGTLANIIRADHRSFDAAVEYLWAERLYTLDDLKQIQKRLADVQNPDRYTKYLMSIRRFGVRPANPMTAFVEYTTQFPRLQHLRIASPELDVGLVIRRTARGAIRRVRMVRHMIDVPFLVKIRSMLPSIIPLDGVGGVQDTDLNGFAVATAPANCRLLLESFTLFTCKHHDSSDMAIFDQLASADRIGSVIVTQNCEHIECLEAFRENLDHMLDIAQSSSLRVRNFQIRIPPISYSEMERHLVDVCGGEPSIQMIVSCSVSPSIFAERHTWRPWYWPVLPVVRRRVSISIELEDEFQMSESPTSRLSRSTIDQSWLMSLARLCIRAGGVSGHYGLSYVGVSPDILGDGEEFGKRRAHEDLSIELEARWRHLFDWCVSQVVAEEEAERPGWRKLKAS